MAKSPPFSSLLMPECYRPLMLSNTSPIIDLYPSKFSIDMNGRTRIPEGIPLLPFLGNLIPSYMIIRFLCYKVGFISPLLCYIYPDMDRLIVALAPLERQLTEYDQVVRNTQSSGLGRHILFTVQDDNQNKSTNRNDKSVEESDLDDEVILLKPPSSTPTPTTTITVAQSTLSKQKYLHNQLFGPITPLDEKAGTVSTKFGSLNNRISIRTIQFLMLAFL